MKKKLLMAIKANVKFEPRSAEEKRMVHELICKGYVKVIEFDPEGGSKPLLLTTNKGDNFLRFHQ